MKKIFLALTALVTLGLVSCNEKSYINGPGEANPQIPDTIPEMAGPTPTADPQGVDVPEGTLNVYEALKICKKLAAGAQTEDSLYVKGWIYQLDKNHASGMSSFGNATFYICPCSDGRGADFSIEAYRVYGKGKKPFDKTEVGLSQVQVGDFVVIRGKFTNYNNKVIETTGNGSAYIYSSSNPNF